MTFAEMVPILAQAGGGGGGGADAADAGALIGILGCYAGIFALAYGIRILFLLTLSKALKACEPENQTMPPGQVWLALIPLVGIIFLIMAIFKVPDSLANEYRYRGMRSDDDFGKNYALWYILGAFLCGPVGLVFWIMYWVTISKHTKALTEGGASRARDDYEDEDDRPSRRKSKYADEDEDDRPSKRRPRDDDEDEDDRPSKRRRRDDDD